MKFFHLKRTRSRVHHTRRYPLYAGLAVVLALAVTLGIVWAAKNRAQASASLAKQNLATRVQNDLNAAMRAFDGIDLPTADIEGDILPTMRLHLYAARVCDQVMTDTYGENVVDAQLLDQIESAIREVARQISLGQSTSGAKSALGAYLDQLETDLSERFADTGMLLSRTALK